MSTVVPKKVFLRGVLLYYFNMKKTSDESHRILVEVYGDHALAERTCQKWFGLGKRGAAGTAEKVRRCTIEGITRPKLVSNARGAGRNVRSDSIIHFVAFESHGNDSEARKLGAVSTEAERRGAPIFHL